MTVCDNHVDPVVETRRKARKEHFCWECGLVIPKGVLYVYTSGIAEDGPVSYKQHVECHELLTKYALDDEGCWIYGSLRQYADDAAADDPITVGLAAVQAKYALAQEPETA